MKISDLLKNHIHHGMVTAIVATDLWPHLIRGEYEKTFRKVIYIGILMLGQHYLKNFFPSLSPSSRVMVGIACYDHVSYSKKCSRTNYHIPPTLIAILTVGIALRSLNQREHGFLDLAAAVVAGKIFGYFWNYSFD